MPVEQSVACLQDLFKAGKYKAVGLSELSAGNICRAHELAGPIACVEMEWSLFSRDIEADIVPACRQLGISIVAYAPLSRGLLTGAIKETPEDFRGTTPRFTEANLAANLKLVDAVEVLAREKGVLTSQVALAWVMAQGADVVPIPGTTNPVNLASNVAAMGVALTTQDMARLEAACPWEAVAGGRVPRTTP